MPHWRRKQSLQATFPRHTLPHKAPGRVMVAVVDAMATAAVTVAMTATVAATVAAMTVMQPHATIGSALRQKRQPAETVRADLAHGRGRRRGVGTDGHDRAHARRTAGTDAGAVESRFRRNALFACGAYTHARTHARTHTHGVCRCCSHCRAPALQRGASVVLAESNTALSMCL